MSFDNDSTLQDSALFATLLAQSVPSDESLDRCVKVVISLGLIFSDLGSLESFVSSLEMANIWFPCVEKIAPGAIRVSQSFGLFEPLIQKIVTVAGNLGFNYSEKDAQFHFTTSFLCRLMGAESLETRPCVLRAVCRNLEGVRFANPPLEWPVTETTPFSVNSDGTLKEETLLGKCSILLTESMETIETLLTDICDDHSTTLSTHCQLVTSAFSCLALVGEKNEEAKEILKSKEVLQQIGVWTGSLLQTPLTPARKEAVVPVVQILLDVQSHSHSADLISLDLVFPDSSTPLADLLTLIDPLLTINSNTARTIIGRFLGPCSKCCKRDSEDKSLLFAFFNKFVASEDFVTNRGTSDNEKWS
ncbi:hypothetical protein BLNAU_12305 [Blattamonas nauphoetae]|uniref:MMS19 nucleotide excision repair protein n=1 Tax=Blattamonas nauphoetae TaxID=2049346 RepID=A0ABQ9XJQ2_9EUKA|nr:hypothetical protein BLNAU_12305 [Blattamonas nauphoetae]